MDLTQHTDRRRPGRPNAQAAVALERHILSNAVRLFVEQGYSATSMEQIAAVSGAGKQTLYRRYASKGILFTEALGEMSREIARVRGGRGRSML